MLTLVAGICVALLDFPQVPLAFEVERGVTIYAQGRGLERLYLDDRQVVGTWFDGRLKRDADHVLWLSPALISRWLGFLEAKEKWPHGELENRWGRLRASLQGRLTFVVRLASLPRIDPIEGEIADEADPRDSRHVRFLWTSSSPERPFVGSRAGRFDSRRVTDGLRFEPKACLVHELQARSASEALREDWWLRVPFGEALMLEFSPGVCDAWPLGEFYSSTYLVRLPLPQSPLPSSQFELRIFSPRKERIARFRLDRTG